VLLANKSESAGQILQDQAHFTLTQTLRLAVDFAARLCAGIYPRVGATLTSGDGLA